MAHAKRVEPGEKVRLDQVNPGEDGGMDKERAEARLAELGKRLADLTELMFAAGSHGLLIVLQGRDTSGKDGTIKAFMRHVNVQTIRVEGFKVPTPEELNHDFLWRVHRVVPGKGDLVLFNRSHYEDVLVVRVHELVGKELWEPRFDQINEFERLLAANNIILLKFLLHIDADEQLERLREREQNPEKGWALSVRDWQERDFWDAYTEAFEDVLNRCSTDEAPWFVVPGNHKWFRNVAVFERVIEALEPYEKEWQKTLSEMGKEELEAIRAYRKEKGISE